MFDQWKHVTVLLAPMMTHLLFASATSFSRGLGTGTGIGTAWLEFKSHLFNSDSPAVSRLLPGTERFKTGK